MTIASKIAKIIAKADSTTSPEEADIFMAKAYQLMEEHGLSLLDLGRLDEDDPVGKSEDVYTSSENWKDNMANQLALYYGCKMVMMKTSSRSKSYIIFGRESARVTFTLMLPFVMRQVLNLSNIEHRAGKYKSRHLALVAVSSALAVRIMKMRKQNEVRQEGSGLNALVPVDMIELAMREAFPSIRTSRPKLKYDHNAEQVANRVRLNHQAPAPKGTLKLGN